MKKIMFLFTIFIMFSCGNIFEGVSPQIAADASKTLDSLPKERASELRKAMKDINPNYREGMAFLIAYMPSYDLDTLAVSLIVENVNYAYKARESFSWTKELPQDIFLNEVLPYSSMDETRDNWRPLFFDMLYPLVKECKDMYQAIDTVNKALKGLVDVEYNTARKKPNQSPSESMEINMASCSGLSILLTDAFRAVGIPSRIAGTPMWVSKEGNHNWSEVWVDGRWYFTEYYPGKLNHSWFLPRAAAADTTDNPIYQVYATSFKPNGKQHFPMVWARKDKSVPGIKVTDEYVRIYKEQVAEAAKRDGVPIVIKAYKKGGDKEKSNDRVAVSVEIFDSKDNIVAKGKTTGAAADMNDYLTLYIPENQKYIVSYDGNKKRIETKDKTKPIELVLFE